MTPTFSIGISFKNPGAYFEMALKSVFAQTRTDWELILVDDGSSDNSLALARSLRDVRVRVYSDGLNRNLNVRLNLMVQMARGRYFVRMDADDVMHPERLERQYQVLALSGPNTVVGSSAYSISADSEIIGLRGAACAQQTGFGARHSFCHPTVAASVEWFRNHPYSEKPVYQRAEDAELWCRASATSEFVTIPDPLLYYREMGAVSFASYVSTETGILHLLCERYRRPFLTYAARVSCELGKIWLAFMCEGMGQSGWMDRHRYRKLPPEAIPSALAGLNRVHAQLLPRMQEICTTANPLVRKRG